MIYLLVRKLLLFGLIIHWMYTKVFYPNIKLDLCLKYKRCVQVCFIQFVEYKECKLFQRFSTEFKKIYILLLIF